MFLNFFLINFIFQFFMPLNQQFIASFTLFLVCITQEIIDFIINQIINLLLIIIILNFYFRNHLIISNIIATVISNQPYLYFCLIIKFRSIILNYCFYLIIHLINFLNH